MKKGSFPWAMLVGASVMTAFIYKQGGIKTLFASYLPKDTTELVVEYTLQSKKYVPEEFYITLFGSDDFLPDKSYIDCYPQTRHCLGLEAFLILDGEYHHDADLYSFAIQGIKSGHRPHNRKQNITKNHDQTVTWLDAIHTLTRLKPENKEEQNLIRSWIVANYENFVSIKDFLDPEALEFIFTGEKVTDIKYRGKNKEIQYSLETYTDGWYQDDDHEWVPSDITIESFVVSDAKRHLILPATGRVEKMLVVPDYLLKDITTVSAAVYTGKGQYSKYIIRMKEINAELEQLDKNKSSGILEGNAQTILTPTLELVVQDICRGKKGREAKLQALLDTLQRENYSDSKRNSPPLVTLVAGGQCGGTSGQFAAMLKLCSFDEYQFVTFPKANHIGVYMPKTEHVSMDLSKHHPSEYLYVETTNGKVRNFADVLLSYMEGEVPITSPQVFDLRPQLQDLPSAKAVERK